MFETPDVDRQNTETTKVLHVATLYRAQVWQKRERGKRRKLRTQTPSHNKQTTEVRLFHTQKKQFLFTKLLIS